MEIRILGNVEIHNDQDVLTLTRSAERCLLGLLAVDVGRPIAVTTLLDRIWGEEGRSEPKPGTLTRYVGYIRDALERANGERSQLRHDSRAGAYMLDVDPDTVDYHRFLRETRDAGERRDPERLYDALGLWRGSPMENVRRRWVDNFRHHAQAHRRTALARLWELLLERGRHHEIPPQFGSLETDIVHDERLLLLGAEALARTGRHVDITAWADHIATRVRDLSGGAGLSAATRIRLHHLATHPPGPTAATPREGTPPSPEGAFGDTGSDHQASTDAVAADYLFGDQHAHHPMPARAVHGTGVGALVPAPHSSSVVSGVPRQLPIGPFHFVGRAAHLAELDRLADLSDRQTTSIVVMATAGTAGVGKTALILHWAHRSKGRFPDGHLYVNLQGYGPGPPLQPDHALGAFVRALGVPAEQVPIELEQLAALYRSLLDGQRMLIVLDNASDADQVRPLIPGSPGPVVMITSRSRLAGLIAREGAYRILLEPLSVDEATALVTEIVGERARAEESATRELVKLCDCLPLALRIAAERVASHPYATLTGLVAELAIERNRLDILRTDDISTQMRTVLSWSYRSLSRDAARAFHLLALNPGPEFGIPAAAALVDATSEQCLPLLDALVNAHLLEQVEWGRYRFHDLTRTYANEYNATDGEAPEAAFAVRRVLLWYLAAADSLRSVVIPHDMPISLAVPDKPSPHLAVAGDDGAIAWYERELVNLEAAIRVAARSGQHDLAWRTAAALWSFFYLRKHWPEWIEAFETGLRSARQEHSLTGEAWMLTMLAVAHCDLRNFDQAYEAIRTATAQWRSAAHRWGEGISYIVLGEIHYCAGKFSEAAEACSRAVELIRDFDDIWGMTFAIITLGNSCRRLLRLDEAIVQYERALAMARSGGNRYTEAFALLSIGETKTSLGQSEDGLAHFGRALSIWREIGNRQGEGRTLFAIGTTHCDVEDLAAARRSWRDALAVLDELGDPQAADVRACLDDLERRAAGNTQGAIGTEGQPTGADPGIERL
ncbi:AfsR/SARP family transcriptional regulator [Saccharothrix lopnurensis]|uniref:Tetratricopeptide repeat protein n=1 Tax=Saccharothrix lopnurensis TaxID=1670621 RepID=A0ABW1PGQ1_9PSEU